MGDASWAMRRRIRRQVAALGPRGGDESGSGRDPGDDRGLRAAAARGGDKLVDDRARGRLLRRGDHGLGPRADGRAPAAARRGAPGGGGDAAGGRSRRRTAEWRAIEGLRWPTSARCSRARVIGSTRDAARVGVPGAGRSAEGFDGLSALVSAQLGRDPLSGRLLLFVNRSRTRRRCSCGTARGCASTTSGSSTAASRALGAGGSAARSS